MKREEKHKAIAIPVTFIDDKPRFLTVMDQRFQEWIFVTGGCRKREVYNPIRCALRELEEETRGTVNIKSGLYTTFTFETTEQSPQELQAAKDAGIDMVLIYHVFIFFVKFTRDDQKELVAKFNEEKAKMQKRKDNKLPIKRTYDENTHMAFDTLETFARKRRWPMIIRHVINNPDFYAALNSLNKKPFNIR
jgi:hypothetical protein